MRTYSPKASELSHEWFIIDATDIVLGRLASHVAVLLRGKHKPTFAAHMDNGDFVIIVNAGKVALTGSKLEQKKAYRHSGYMGGLTTTSYSDLMAKNPGHPWHASKELSWRAAVFKAKGLRRGHSPTRCAAA